MLALLLEIGALIAIAQGVHAAVDHPLLGWVAPAAAVIAVVLLWARFAAPRSTRRLRGGALIAFKACVFGAASLSLLVAAGPAWAAVYAALAAAQIVLAMSFGRP